MFHPFHSLFYRTTETGGGEAASGQIVPFLFSSRKGYGSGSGFGSILEKTEAGNHKVGFDDVLYLMKQMASILGIQGSPDPKKCPYLFINTMPIVNQSYLIKYTVSYQIEESMMNSILEDFRTDLSKYVIVLYGKNCADDSVDRKSKQLIKLGFQNVFIYYGGLFEWCLLQDVYGEDSFPTDGKKSGDILDYSPKSKFRV